MKRIIQTFKENGHNDGLKLRLWGKGSGFKEGPHKQESNDTLHLCLSSSDYEVFQQGCWYVEELMTKIYKEYSSFTSKKTGTPVCYSISKSENIPASFQGTMYLN